VQRTRRRDDDPVEACVQQAVEIARQRDAGNVGGGRPQALVRGIRQGNDMRDATPGEGPHPVAADPARAEKSQPRPRRGRHGAHRGDRRCASAPATAEQ